VSSAKRSPYLPELPTVAEAGVPGYETTAWYGMLVPAGTSAEIIARLNAETAKALNMPDVKARLDATGMVPATSTPEQLGKQIQAEIAKWGKIVKALNLKVD
jgi:tripartite-type tricarboxylate transporter receptor subunit TctC